MLPAQASIFQDSQSHLKSRNERRNIRNNTGFTSARLWLPSSDQSAEMLKKGLVLGILAFTALTQISFDDPAPTGQDIYKRKCQRCHGEVGTKGAFGAKNLQQSKMKYDDVVALILNGKRPMPGFQSKLTKVEIGLVADFTMKLRK